MHTRARPPGGAAAPVALAAAGCALVLALGGCAPALDWREVRPPDAAAAALMPCRPSSYEREVRLAGVPVRLSLQACTAGEQTWALATADLRDPALVGPALRELAASARANVGGGNATPLPLAVPGATPNPDSARLSLTGRLPDGQPVQEQVAVFAHGTRVFQATVIGARLEGDAVETFFGSLKTGR